MSIFTQPNSGMMEGVVGLGSIVVEGSLGGTWKGISKVMSIMSPECEGSIIL